MVRTRRPLEEKMSLFWHGLGNFRTIHRPIAAVMDEHGHLS